MKKTLLAVAAGLALAFANSAFAQSTDDKVIAAAWAAVDASTPSSGSATARTIGWVEGEADADAPPLISTFIAVSPTQTGLPCFSCAPDPPVGREHWLVASAGVYPDQR